MNLTIIIVSTFVVFGGLFLLGLHLRYKHFKDYLKDEIGRFQAYSEPPPVQDRIYGKVYTCFPSTFCKCFDAVLIKPHYDYEVTSSITVDVVGTQRKGLFKYECLVKPRCTNLK